MNMLHDFVAASLVVRGLRQMGTKRQLAKAKRKSLEVICGYLEYNAFGMA